MLACKIFRSSEIRVHVLVAVVPDKCYVLGIVLAQRDTDFNISVDRAVENVRTPWVDFSRVGGH